MLLLGPKISINSNAVITCDPDIYASKAAMTETLIKPSKQQTKKK